MKKLVSFLLPFILLFSATSVFANVSVPTAQANNAKVLVVLLSKQASIQATKKPGVFELNLKGVNPQAIYFSNRPARLSGQIATDKFINQWKSGEFKHSAPNAVMEAVRLNLQTNQLSNVQSSYAIVLKNPVYAMQKDELNFQIRALPGNKLPLPVLAKSDYVAIFIDDVCLTCIG